MTMDLPEQPSQSPQATKTAQDPNVLLGWAVFQTLGSSAICYLVGPASPALRVSLYTGINGICIGLRPFVRELVASAWRQLTGDKPVLRELDDDLLTLGREIMPTLYLLVPVGLGACTLVPFSYLRAFMATSLKVLWADSLPLIWIGIRNGNGLCWALGALGHMHIFATGNSPQSSGLRDTAYGNS
jgi:hypothetical protein